VLAEGVALKGLSASPGARTHHDVMCTTQQDAEAAAFRWICRDLTDG